MKLVAHTHSYRAKTLSSFQLSPGFGTNCALGIHMTLTVSSRDKKPQQLVMIPGHKVEGCWEKLGYYAHHCVVSNNKWRQIEALPYACSISRQNICHLR